MANFSNSEHITNKKSHLSIMAVMNNLGFPWSLGCSLDPLLDMHTQIHTCYTIFCCNPSQIKGIQPPQTGSGGEKQGLSRPLAHSHRAQRWGFVSFGVAGGRTYKASWHRFLELLNTHLLSTRLN